MAERKLSSFDLHQQASMYEETHKKLDLTEKKLAEAERQKAEAQRLQEEAERDKVAVQREKEALRTAALKLLVASGMSEDAARTALQSTEQ